MSQERQYRAFELVTFGIESTEHSMVFIPGGEFLMGIPQLQMGENYEKPQHPVRIKHSFLMDATLVTQRLYKSIMGDNPSESSRGLYYPVENVSWYDAVRFCNALSEEESLEPVYAIDGKNITVKWDANGYRLPTEAEWEYVAKAGTDNKFAGSQSAEDVAWFTDNSHEHTRYVCSKDPNEWGLFDLTGNVWEWVWDWFSEEEYGSRNEDNASDNPLGPERGFRRVNRGGGFQSTVDQLLIQKREFFHPDYRFDDLGFRVMRLYGN